MRRFQRKHASFDDVYSAEQDLQSGWMATSNLFIPDPEMRRKFRSELLDVGQENMNRLGLFACRAAYEAAGNGWISLSAIWLAIWHWCAISVKTVCRRFNW